MTANGAGHAGTALSAALGMAVARDLAGTKENIVAFRRGRRVHQRHKVLKALNNIAQQTKRLIVVLERQRMVDRSQCRRDRQLPAQNR